MYSGIKLFINEYEIKKIESEIKQKYDEEITNFIGKCRIGENYSYICSLIRQDAAEEFISYVNRTNISLLSQIRLSIFETNLFLMEKTPTLIEYASFYGSIQIIQYLRYSKVPLTYSMWFYTIHSNNAELIHCLEENEIKPVKKVWKAIFLSKFSIKTQQSVKYKNMITKNENEESITYEEIFKEAIICHHNAIADYIKDNFLDQTPITNFESIIINCTNYYYFPSDLEYIMKIISR